MSRHLASGKAFALHLEDICCGQMIQDKIRLAFLKHQRQNSAVAAARLALAMDASFVLSFCCAWQQLTTALDNSFQVFIIFKPSKSSGTSQPWVADSSFCSRVTVSAGRVVAALVKYCCPILVSPCVLPVSFIPLFCTFTFQDRKPRFLGFSEAHFKLRVCVFQRGI